MLILNPKVQKWTASLLLLNFAGVGLAPTGLTSQQSRFLNRAVASEADSTLTTVEQMSDYMQSQGHTPKIQLPLQDLEDHIWAQTAYQNALSRNQIPSLILAGYLGQIQKMTPHIELQTPQHQAEMRQFADAFWKNYNGDNRYLGSSNTFKAIQAANSACGLVPTCKPYSATIAVGLSVADAVDKVYSEALTADQISRVQTDWKLSHDQSIAILIQLRQLTVLPEFADLIDDTVATKLNLRSRDSLAQIFRDNPNILEGIKNTSKELYGLLVKQGYYPNDSANDVDLETLARILGQTENAIKLALKESFESLKKAGTQNGKSLPVDLNKSIQDALKLSEQERKAEELKTKLELERIQTNQQGILSTASLISGILAKDYPEVSRGILTTTQFGLKMAKANEEFAHVIATQGSSLTKIMGAFTWMNALVGGLGALQALIGPASIMPEQMILDQLREIREQLVDLQVQLNSRFDLIDARLTEIYSTMLAEFEFVNRRLDYIDNNLESIRWGVQKLNQKLTFLGQKFEQQLKDDLARKYYIDHLNCIVSPELFPGAPINRDSYRDCLVSFLSRATEGSRLSPWVTQASNDSLNSWIAEGSESIRLHSVASNLNALLTIGAQLDSSVRRPQRPLPNSDEWILASRAFLATLDAHPHFDTVSSSAPIDQLIQVGQEIQAARKALIGETIVNGTQIRETFFRQMSSLYEDAVNNLARASASWLRSYNRTKNKSLDPWMEAPDMGASLASGSTWGNRLAGLRELEPCNGSQLKRKVQGFPEPTKVLPPDALPVILANYPASASATSRSCISVARIVTQKTPEICETYSQPTGSPTGDRTVCYRLEYSDLILNVTAYAGDIIAAEKMDIGSSKFLTQVTSKQYYSPRLNSGKGKKVSSKDFYTRIAWLEDQKKAVLSTDAIFDLVWDPNKPDTGENRRMLKFQSELAKTVTLNSLPGNIAIKQLNSKLRSDLIIDNVSALRSELEKGSSLDGVQAETNFWQEFIRQTTQVALPISVNDDDITRGVIIGTGSLHDSQNAISSLIENQVFKGPQGLSASNYDVSKSADRVLTLLDLIRLKNKSPQGGFEADPAIDQTLVLLSSKKQELEKSRASR